MISVEGLKVEFNATPLFEDVTYVINKKDRIALVGKNGAGKSTMLKILAGLQQPTSGVVALPKDTTIGYLPQVMVLADKNTVMQEAEKAFEHIFDMQKELERMNQELAERTDYESEDYHKLIDRFTHENERFLMMGGTNFHAEIERTLVGLGFKREDFDRPTSEFSGGWRMRIELAKLLLRQPDVLLLDEPTNHLDIESIQWLETFLSTRANAVVLVSHDRAFINNVTTRTIEISCGHIYDYKVSYDQYVILRKERREQQLRAYENQQKQIQDTEDFIERFRYKATKAVQVQSRIKQLEKIERIEVDEEDNSALRLKFPPASRSGSYPIICEDVQKKYGNHVVFHDVNLTINRGDKVAFVGKNGEGKSTLVKCIMNEIDFDGKLVIGHNVQIGYFAQNQAQMLEGELTVFDTIDRVAVGDIRNKIRDILGAFMFGGEASDKKVKVLSGGERSRLAMIKLLLQPVNLLILDEPTNHLDMRSKDVLKEAIREFEGTVILVSHDRDFLDGLATKVYEFGSGLVKEHLGGIYEFLQRKKLEDLNELQKSIPSGGSATSTIADSQGVVSDNKLSYEAQKELNKKIKKMEKQVADCEKAIEELESAIAIVETKMGTVEGASDMSLYEQHQKLKMQLDRTVEEWEQSSIELDEIKTNG
ncbi:MAG: ABC-F family ATP-binding cassette domain-containing protein [Bacteroides graminisolvens]|jgi:ATP-binding cassette subfamily F protein 3|uniref:ABC-F family ATP-binding cassette domain-containing protein n=1 Tax=Bacteroides graminisolvens TaxID=477666 RepID=UPI001B546EEB|nr:ABC-F family ATP-binding cassette domain-containing protein [Bacteroides graminisolvens]MBP6069554.1 ABC-F family ATP-binding cassette domain-containing protein [Bacteroides sp.]MBP9495499.1 ABC-F family ATP-binding cassette domain-containing protein [Bacteroides sp.]MBP9720047.1 ABC-F family ATP-binding cassette domain-containing protein [Bacteroides sp.]MEA4886762.1 ABC-F family ATP-binding cassette domain-containing protein [Bacteroides graminisolvens]